MTPVGVHVYEFMKTNDTDTNQMIVGQAAAAINRLFAEMPFLGQAQVQYAQKVDGKQVFMCSDVIRNLETLRDILKAHAILNHQMQDDYNELRGMLRSVGTLLNKAKQFAGD
jgi:hypothetical protein